MRNKFQMFLSYGIVIVLLLGLCESGYANNFDITNVSLEGRDAIADIVVVEFDISWDNSWRNGDQHDAVWVFLKVLVNSTAPHVHGDLATAGSNPGDTSKGSNSDVDIYIPTDRVGALIRRNTNGTGTMSSTNVQLTLDYGGSGIEDTDTIEVAVIGAEMVYITSGSYYAGDGDTANESTNALYANGSDNTSVQISSGSVTISCDTNADDDIDTTPLTVDGDGGLSGNSSWPTGYDDYYVMKYEISQGQYRDFLNTLSRTQQNVRTAADVSGNSISNFYVMSNTSTVSNRQVVRAPDAGNGTTAPVVFGCDYASNGSAGNATFDETGDGEGIAMNYLTWMDLAAYADWAGLRPMTELEFEKAARGPNNAVYAEYAWGSTTLTQAEGAIQNGGEAGEVANTTGNGLCNYNGAGTDISGPARCGFAATSSTNRVGGGAGYYGNMELSGNVVERCVTIGNSTGRAFQGSHGDGMLTTAPGYEGNASNTDWPGIDGTSERGVTGAAGSGFRGGAWGYTSSYAQVSDRTSAATTDTTRENVYGGRLVRTAP
ncbi:MAG: SUMF1/EgtB/PvdO family nonheme iron enzyme [Candidatus Omnitrophica bacterium]|nr:SUMF1/EgtB/PvdO family nonheme iron enzyme [Candidatus Omnitrophota bacterium]